FDWCEKEQGVATENVLCELIPDCHKRIRDAIADLKSTLAEMEETKWSIHTMDKSEKIVIGKRASVLLWRGNKLVETQVELVIQDNCRCITSTIPELVIIELVEAYHH
ncbi:unnamed protein product, partial [Thlaspi arvense]